MSSGAVPGGPPAWTPRVTGASRASSPLAVAMPSLDFSVTDADVLEHAAVPTIRFELDIDAGDAVVRSLSLSVQIRIDAGARRYREDEHAPLWELFGAPGDWGRNLRPLLWAHSTLVVPAFEGRTRADLLVPCSYDFDVAAHKYLNAVRDGVIPLELLFSGSVFYEGREGALQTVRLPWDRECRFAMHAALWHATMERYFPNSAWLRVRSDVFDRLCAYRSAQGLPTWEATLEALLPSESGSAGAPGRQPDLRAPSDGASAGAGEERP